jgi:hypothetical protein
MKHRLSWSAKRAVVVDAAWISSLRNGWSTNAFGLSQLENSVIVMATTDNRQQTTDNNNNNNNNNNKPCTMNIGKNAQCGLESCLVVTPQTSGICIRPWGTTSGGMAKARGKSAWHKFWLRHNPGKNKRSNHGHRTTLSLVQKERSVATVERARVPS